MDNGYVSTHNILYTLRVPKNVFIKKFKEIFMYSILLNLNFIIKDLIYQIGKCESFDLF